MTKKFTEEQYREIINIWNNGQDFDDTILSVSDYARKLNARLNYEYGDDVYDYSEAILLAFPNSRYWAREEFVEKENKYVWRLKSDNDLVISKWSSGWFADEFPTDNMYFSEKEIENSPFKPEWFEKEEVQD